MEKIDVWWKELLNMWSVSIRRDVANMNGWRKALLNTWSLLARIHVENI